MVLMDLVAVDKRIRVDHYHSVMVAVHLVVLNPRMSAAFNHEYSFTSAIVDLILADHCVACEITSECYI